MFSKDAVKDDVVICGGSEVGCMLVDGRGDGVCLEHPSQDVEYLRLTSFGMLQVNNMLHGDASSHVSFVPLSLERVNSFAIAEAL